MRPCDCKDRMQSEALNEQGIGFNDIRLFVKPAYVLIENGPCSMKIPMRVFKSFAEFYLEDQR